ncbi:N-acetyltransferase [Leptolyngbya sp. 'hensonii']|uniref:GNAT family N-acetyltransferase n=1 Tax=Leptolyngbya sp. 'hensonii' TaxID=1922337 RepID=UPI00094F7617|nr:GNAT family N-acetyltransferase [Leptolyngbya sp. 'hensonii']OLP19057.1 N-acetyltransferase [Leptolyngbya sp. 'hensonii']
MEIRDAIEADLPAIVEIYNATIPGCMVTGDMEPVSVESRIAWFYQHEPAQRPLWVVEVDGTVAGWLGFQSFYGRPAYQVTAEISLYVAEAYRRQGLGRLLLEQAIAKSPGLGLTTLLGFVFGHNKPSLKLFQSLGFERWGYLPKIAVLNGVERDLVIMGYRVNSPPQPSQSPDYPDP